MNRLSFKGLIAGLFLSSVTFSGAMHASDKKDFLGIWQGNDPLDGGLITLEITEHVGGDDILDLRFSDTFIRACTVPPIANLPVGDAVDNRRGIYLGYAKAQGKDLVSTGSFPGAGRVIAGAQEVPGGTSDQVLSPAGSTVVQVPIYCYKASAPGTPFLSVQAFWKMRKVGDALVMTGTLFTDDPSTPYPAIETADGPNSMRFHKINKAD
ncbi:MAG: hypothetical protein LLG20_06780 [Acidobacteriales bacterium]|nr:hypothetical protein [Terriglobales bacterium]